MGHSNTVFGIPLKTGPLIGLRWTVFHSHTSRLKPHIAYAIFLSGVVTRISRICPVWRATPGSGKTPET